MKSKPKNSLAVILGAGAPETGGEPTLSLNLNGDSVLSWLIKKFEPKAKVTTVLGYQSEAIASQFHDVDFIVNAGWKTSGSVGSLFSVDLSNIEDLIVCYGDILIRDNLVEQLLDTEAHVLVACDGEAFTSNGKSDCVLKWNTESLIYCGEAVVRLGRDLPINSATGEFIGLVRFNKEAIKIIRDLQANSYNECKSMFLSELVEFIRLQGVPISRIDATGEWAEIAGEETLAEFVLGTKAETLSRMKGLLKKSEILEQVSFTIGEWESSKDDVIRKIRKELHGSVLAVRSSARSEDGFDSSNAGAYESKLNVGMGSELEAAINSVIRSYGNASSKDQVLVQPMLQSIAMSGVVFTRTLETSSPWYVVNYETNGSTEGVTSGTSKTAKTYFHFRHKKQDLITDYKMRRLIDAIIEIEECIFYDKLDIEFAITSDGTVYIFQIRPIAVQNSDQNWIDTDFIRSVGEAEKSWNDKFVSNRQIVGKNTMYGVMPDWNPAEIIGVNPNKLADTLYKMVITDHVWARQRAEFGYRDVRPSNLLVNFCGKPYVDVRASFNSFLPASLNEELASRLVDFYVETLKVSPELHDKVEFSIVPTCFGPNFVVWRKQFLKDDKFTENEIFQLEESLKLITNDAIRSSERNDDDLALFTEECNNLIKKNDSSSNFLAQAQMLLNFCETKGTLFFAHQARNAFVAMTLLKEAVLAGVISETSQVEFLQTIRTVSHELNQDAKSVRHGTLSWLDFVSKYGHLRPGTYDIESLAYKDDPESFLRPLTSISEVDDCSIGMPKSWNKEKSKLFSYLNNIGIEGAPDSLENYLRSSIEGREKSKFEFSRCLSSALDFLVLWGEKNGLSRSELSNMSIGEIMSMSEIVDSSVQVTIQQNLKVNKKSRDLMRRCELPPLITSIDDITSFTLRAGTPNFIGSRVIRAKCVLLNLENSSNNLSGSIIVIEQADPGFDWLFSRGIIGLITLYGGTNSHMAIRAAEFGITAAIGVGASLYSMIKSSESIELDPINKQVKKLS